MPYPSEPWMVRGGHYDGSTGAGEFASGNDNGNAYLYISTRSVLVNN